MDYKKTESVIIGIVLIFAIIGIIMNVSSADLVGQAYKRISHSAPVPNAVCEDLITESLVLNTNLKCDNTGLFVGADDITIDCNGHTISYSKSNYGHGIDNEQGYNGVTIQNCKIKEEGTDKFIVRYGIYFKDDVNSNIQNNNVEIISSRAAIKMENSQNLNLKENTIKVNAPWMSGIWLNGIEEGIINKNKIITIGDSEYGMNIRYSDRIIVENNYVNTDGYGTQAIYFTGSNEIYINNNYVTTSTKSGSNGIAVPNSNNIKIINNYVQARGGFGILSSQYDTIDIINNVVKVEKEWTEGIHINNGQNAKIKNNNIESLENSRGAIFIGGENVEVENNLIESNSLDLWLSQSIGIDIENQEIENYKIENSEFSIENEYGKIEYLEEINMKGINLNEDINIKKNSILVEKEELNKKARLSFILDFHSFSNILQNPIALMDGIICPASICSEVTQQGNEYSYIVEHFTEYSVGEKR